jgi:hypothetical protein
MPVATFHRYDILSRPKITEHYRRGDSAAAVKHTPGHITQ